MKLDTLLTTQGNLLTETNPSKPVGMDLRLLDVTMKAICFTIRGKGSLKFPSDVQGIAELAWPRCLEKHAS